MATERKGIRRKALDWWNKTIAPNTLLRIIKRGELVSKHYGKTRLVRSLTNREIEEIYRNEVELE